MSTDESTKEILVAEINKIKGNIQPEDIKKYKLDILENIVYKLDQLSDDCEECNSFIKTFKANVLNDLKPSGMSPTNNRYQQNIKSMLSHLRITHNVVTEYFFVSVYLPVGIAIGFLIGSLIKNLVFGFAIGITVGLIAGVVIDVVAKRNGLVISSRQKQD